MSIHSLLMPFIARRARQLPIDTTKWPALSPSLLFWRACRRFIAILVECSQVPFIRMQMSPLLQPSARSPESVRARLGMCRFRACANVEVVARLASFVGTRDRAVDCNCINGECTTSVRDNHLAQLTIECCFARPRRARDA